MQSFSVCLMIYGEILPRNWIARKNHFFYQLANRSVLLCGSLLYIYIYRVLARGTLFPIWPGMGWAFESTRFKVYSMASLFLLCPGMRLNRVDSKLGGSAIQSAANSTSPLPLPLTALSFVRSPSGLPGSAPLPPIRRNPTEKKKLKIFL